MYNRDETASTQNIAIEIRQGAAMIINHQADDGWGLRHCSLVQVSVQKISVCFKL